MKRLIVISVLAFVTLSTGVASATVLKPLATAADWNTEPIFATSPPNDGRLFVVERGNATTHQASIRVLRDGVLQPTPFLTVPNINLDTERGLLSMAFAPDYATSGKFYVFYAANGPDALDTGSVGDLRIVEYKVSAANPDVADPTSARLVFRTPHSAGNHNGGWMAFGPDGKLYFTIGDNANSANAQDLTNYYGKVMRLDPTDPDGPGPGTATHTVPSDNPFVGTPADKPEIWTYGLRNPFRASFAPDGNLVIGDVGNTAVEEVDVGDLKGKNMGWPTCEGHCATPNPAFTEPLFTYTHAPDGNCAILGGYVIRDPDLTGLTGRYVYGDLCKPDLRTLNLTVAGGDPVNPNVSIPAGESLHSFGEDSSNCTYVVTNKNVYRIAADASAPTACPHPPVLSNPPPPPVDSTKPGVTLTIKASHLAHRIRFQVKTDEAATLKTTGALHARRKGKKKARDFKYKVDTQDLTADTKTTIQLTLPTKKLKAARKVFRSGRALRAKMVAVATDPSGNATTSRFTIKIRRGKH